MSYQEGISGLISRKQVKQRLGADWADFLETYGDRSQYHSSVVLEWMGA